MNAQETVIHYTDPRDLFLNLNPLSLSATTKAPAPPSSD